MDIPCSVCKEILQKPGALIFTPPDDEDKVLKLHVCVNCFEALVLTMGSGWFGMMQWLGETKRELDKRIKERTSTTKKKPTKKKTIRKKKG